MTQTRYVAERLLGPIYRDEMEQLERHAQAHLATWDSPNHGHHAAATPSGC